MGTGPMWKYYVDAVEPCKASWMFFITFTNNVEQVDMDEKCLPWMWFLPVYVQLSLLLPLIMLTYKKLPKLASTILFTIVFFGGYVLNFIIMVYDDDLMKSKTDVAYHEEIFGYDELYSGYFMQPWYHFNSYFLGILMSIAYDQYLFERSCEE
jgi:hypothetical protein